MFVFDSTGSLVLMGTDSNVADDQVIVDEINNDLLRGSFGTNDPFIGVSELNEGTYFVAVSNQTQVPADLGQFFQADPANPFLRLEPVDSVRRLVEDRLDVPMVARLMLLLFLSCSIRTPSLIILWMMQLFISAPPQDYS